MPKSVLSTLAGLFPVDGQPRGQPLEFRWRLVRRRNRPFLLLPVGVKDVWVGLELYSAQRRRAKIWRATLPLLLRTPLAAIFHRIHFRVDANSGIMQFLAEQTGVPASQLGAPAIKFGGRGTEKSRLVLLVCDQTQRPVRIIKAGLDAGGRAATEREADLLEKLPANTLGCIRLTGRLTTPEISAFATAYFPGKSPEDDAGMEILFHSWINPEPLVPIESLDAWRELETDVAGARPAEWRVLRAALAGREIRTTLHHGDFAPWNIRAVNAQNLQAFDWEGGNLRGIPGWDWFHFVVQTSILARRHPVERVSAEVEELLQSPRFETYAAATGISAIIQPLMLAYLLRHRWVVKPLEGGPETMALYELLAAHWGFEPRTKASASTAPDPGAVLADAPSLWADAREQLSSAWSQLANVFWEPTLISHIQPSLPAQLRTAWPTALFCGLWLGAVANLQYFYTTNHLLLLPIYAIPCLLMTWRVSRRWGMLFAGITGAIGPLVLAGREPAAYPAALICWNALMRFLLLQMCVFLTDRIHRQGNFFQRLITSNHRPANFAGHWAIVLAASLWFLLTAAGDICTGPRMIFLPLYLFPAMLMTLFLGLPWGALVVLLAAGVASADEYLGKLNPSLLEVFGWNCIMRFLILFLVVLLLDRLSHENVLFKVRKPNGGPKA